jgi:hypothetical protein
LHSGSTPQYISEVTNFGLELSDKSPALGKILKANPLLINDVEQTKVPDRPLMKDDAI